MARTVTSTLLLRARARMLRAAQIFDQAERELREARRMLDRAARAYRSEERDRKLLARRAA